MPHVIVRYDPSLNNIETHLHNIALMLPREVVKALSCQNEGGSFTEDDVEVEFSPFGNSDKTNGFSMTFQVDANDYPSRRINLTERNDRLAQAIHRQNERLGWFTGRGYVWTRLLPAAFTTLQAQCTSKNSKVDQK